MSPLVPILLGLMTTFVVGSAAVTTDIIEPIRASGDEVALIFVPGAFQRAENYREIAKIFQEASNLRMWVALIGGYNRLLVSLAELPGAPSTFSNRLEWFLKTTLNQACRALNELARDAALNSATDAEKQRYKSRGRPILLEDDILTTSEDDWNSTPLKTWEDSAGGLPCPRSVAPRLRQLMPTS
ncbi:hypothetical protein RRG08_018650 [Elysia crispata]|uniref:Uncharacterized protein n=1 Tax=Elysia crispata TaxID=231223 RepID=A0AAE0ZTA0_9GAST|nr:hypothetical protein RRG08_018650 [Elysia crispata]